MRPTWRVLLAGVLGSAVLLTLIYRPAPVPLAEAQGVGIFQRASCSAINSPVVGQTVCFDQTFNFWRVWTGAVWQASPITGVTSVKDPPFYAKGDGTTDDTAAIQAAINTGTANGIIYLPPGTYRVTSPLTYTTSVYNTGLRLVGAGMFTSVISSAVANGAAIAISNGGSSTFGVGGELREFGIVQSGVPAASHGIDIRGAWLAEITQIRIAQLTGDGIRITNALGDPDSTSQLGLRRNYIRDNGGWGINVNNTIAINAVASLEIDANVITGNSSGGIQLQAINGSVTRNSIAQNNNAGGLVIRFNGIGNQNIQVVENNFETNSNQHIKIDSLNGGLIALNNFTAYDDGQGFGYRPTRGVVIGDGTNSTQNIKLISNVVRSSPASPTVNNTLYIASANSTNIWIDGTTWQAFSGVNAIRFTDAGTNTTVIDDGNFTFANGITNPRAVISGTGVTSAGMTLRTNASTRWNVYAPSASTNLLFEDGAVQPVVTISAAGALQIATPTGGNTGAGTLNVASATFMNGLASQVASASGVNLANVRGISGFASSTLSNNLRGSCAFAASATCAVVFANNEPNANYFVMVGGIVTISSKLTTGFTMTATGTTSNSVDWMLIR